MIMVMIILTLLMQKSGHSFHPQILLVNPAPLQRPGLIAGFFLEEWLKINTFIGFFNYPLSLNDFNDAI